MSRLCCFMKLAALAPMSRSKFSACFSRIMAVSAMGYVTVWRMKVAQDLLRDGVQIKVIAASVGYSSQVSFSRTFLNVVGSPPPPNGSSVIPVRRFGW